MRRDASANTAAASAFGVPPRHTWWFGLLALLAALALFLAATALRGSSAPRWLPTDLPNCDAAGISAAGGREGICVDFTTVFGDGTVYNVVDAGHTLRMPGFDVRLRAFRIVPTRVTNPQVNPGDYPNSVGQLVSVEVAVTNEGATPLGFDQAGSDDDLVIPDPSGPGPAITIAERVNPNAGPGESIADEGPIAARATVTGWISFVAPSWTASVIHQPGSDVEFYVPGEAAQQYVGQLRLWKAATGQARAELGVSTPTAPSVPTAPTTSTATSTTTTTTSPPPQPVPLQSANADVSLSPDSSRPVTPAAAQAIPQLTSTTAVQCPRAPAPAPSANLDRFWLRFTTLLNRAACAAAFDTARLRREIARMLSAQSCYPDGPVRSSTTQDRYYCRVALDQLIAQAAFATIPDRLANLEFVDGRAYCDVTGLGNVRLIRHDATWG